MTLSAGIAGGINAGFATESIHHETGIIGKTVETVMLLYIACLEFGVTLKCIGSFRYILRTAYVGQSENTKLIAADSAYLSEFIYIIGSKYYFLHYDCVYL